MLPILIILYLLGCLTCAVMGRKTTFGFVGHLWLAILLTPILAFAVQAVGRQARLSGQDVSAHDSKHTSV